MGRTGRFASIFALAGCATLMLAQGVAAVAAATSEYQLKAVFLFNFSQFVDWPRETLGSPGAPFVIGVLGEDPFGGELDDTVRGEKVSGHPLIVKRFGNVTQVEPCQILFIAEKRPERLDRILAALNGRAVLTVTDADRAAERGAMIEFTTQRNRLRLRINVAAARAAGLTISSKLLRPAEIVGPQQG